MKTFQEFQEQMLSAADKKEIKIATLTSAARQNIRNAAWQRRHAYHEMEAKNRREDQDRMRREQETQM
jgi:hypothetical protein